MAFEIYEIYHDNNGKLAIVSISRNYLALNKVAREKLNCDLLELAFDRESNIIRIRPSVDGKIVRKTKIYAKYFFKHFGIDNRGKYKAKYDQNENTLYVDLSFKLK